MQDNPVECSVIVLTMGDRNDEVEALIASVNLGAGHEGLVVSNGEPEPIPDRGWRSVVEPENIGISGGRRLGGSHANGQYLVFLDDDALNLTPDLLDQIAAAFAEAPRLGAIALRVVVDGTDRSLSEWQPRLRGRGELERGCVTSFHGAAHAIRADAYHRVGGYHPNLWYAHEETDLAWRLLDSGWDIEYRPDLKLSHPFAKPRRHRNALWYSARNRIWLGRQHLPLPIAATYWSIWLAIQLLRSRGLSEVRTVLAGSVEGFRSDPGPRRPMRWKTVRRMTHLGRPPVI